MSPALLVAVAVAGGLGAAARFAIDGVVRSRIRGALPVGTILINLSGSLLLGIVTGMAGAALLPEEARAVLGAGFLGGYTTFSAASLETVRLLSGRRRALAVVNGLAVPLAAVALAALGLAASGVLAP